LGLAISRKFCEMMGGSIHVDSKPERGSTFEICLPAELSLQDAHASETLVEVSGLW
jgi:signal transduction histidine kinase